MMRKHVVLLALALVASASFTTADAAKKKKKDKQQTVETVAQPVVLTTGSDSVSYAAGMTMTNGLIPFLQDQMKVDTAYMADFAAGFREAIAAKNDPRQAARLAGINIAMQVENSMMPRARREFTDTRDTIIDSLAYIGFVDAVTGNTTVMNTEWAETFYKDKIKANKDEKEERLTRDGRRYLAQNAKQQGIIVTPSGLQYRILTQGTGEVPQPTDRVRVNYQGWLANGTLFDASSKHGDEPAVFRADKVIPGWTEALTMMPVGSKWQLFVPYNLAYGDRAMGQIPAYSTLIFEVELVGIEK